MIWPSSDRYHTVAASDHNYERSRHGPRWTRKTRRFEPVPRHISRTGPPSLDASQSRLFSSAEDSNSRASSPVSELCAVNSTHQKHISHHRHIGEKGKNRATHEATKTQTSTSQTISSVDSWIAKQASLIDPIETGHNSTNDEVEVQDADNKSARAQAHTRATRLQQQPRQVGTGKQSGSAAGESRRAFSGDRSSSHPHIDGAAGMPPLSNLIMTELAKSLNQTTIYSGTQQNTKQNKPRSDVQKTKMKNGSSSKAAKLTDAASVYPTAHEALASNSVSEDDADKSTRHFIQGLSSSAYRFPFDHNSRVSPEPTTGPPRFPIFENNPRRARERNHAPVIADKHGAFFDYAEPLTPTEMPYTDHSLSPHIVNDSWSDHRADMEWEADEMAERDLASASKLFDSLSDCIGGSATSTFQTTSFAMRSNISIVSCDSDSDHSGNNTTTPSIKEAEVEEDIEGSKVDRPFERIGEF